ncbi:hypothetical protein [Gordonia desulfuricans]|nr:hypothetical protein [Gordonia desulfuricans]
MHPPGRPRRLTNAEKDFARAVFGPRADWLDTVVLTGFIGWRGRAFVFPLTRRTVLCNIGDCAARPTTSSTPAYPQPGRLFVHELVHVWQFTHRRRARTLATAIWEQVRHLRGTNVYHLAATPPEWDAMTLEQQATVVDRWFAGSSPTRAPMDADSPYRRFVEHVRHG